MNFFEFPGVKISALAAAIPDNCQINMDLADLFVAGEMQKFCQNTGIWERYVSKNGITASDLCVAAANEIFDKLDVDRASIDGLLFISQTPDYMAPPTSCVIQHRLGLDNCGLVFDSNIGCTGFPYGVQMACANIMAGCKKILLLVGDADPERGWNGNISKDSLLFGDCGAAAIIERTDEPVSPIRCNLHTIGKGYKSLLTPFGAARHQIADLYRERGGEGLEGMFVVGGVMEGTDVFTFSITDVPKTAKQFFTHFDCTADSYDLISIHQANKMIVENVVKRIKAPKEKVIMSLDRFGNTRGASTALNICDYAMRKGIHTGIKHILNLAFGIGLNVAIADFELDMSRCLPIIKTSEAFDDGINNYTYF